MAAPPGAGGAAVHEHMARLDRGIAPTVQVPWLTIGVACPRPSPTPMPSPGHSSLPDRSQVEGIAWIPKALRTRVGLVTRLQDSL